MSGRLGNMTYGVPQEARYLKLPFAPEEKNYSERTAEQIDGEVRQIIDRQYERVKSILTSRRADLNLITATLLKNETLEREELEKLIAESKVDEMVPA